MDRVGDDVVAGVLLCRTRRAASAALLAVVAQVILLVMTFDSMWRWQVLGPALSVTDIVAIRTLGFWAYCNALGVRRVLG